jgi:hypothetical protein
VLVGVAVGVSVGVAVGVCVGVAVGVFVGVWVGVAVAVSVGVQIDVWTQPVVESQLSAVQGSPSSQLSGVWTQPVAGLQLSTEQALPSSQLIIEPRQPLTGSQVLLMHLLPSLQSIGVYVQTRGVPTQEVVVHALAFVQIDEDLWHCPLTQLLGKHGSSGLGVGGGGGGASQIITFEHPKRGSHESFVHPLPSSQLTGV